MSNIIIQAHDKVHFVTNQGESEIIRIKKQKPIKISKDVSLNPEDIIGLRYGTIIEVQMPDKKVIITQKHSLNSDIHSLELKEEMKGDNRNLD